MTKSRQGDRNRLLFGLFICGIIFIISIRAYVLHTVELTYHLKLPTDDLDCDTGQKDELKCLYPFNIVALTMLS